MALKLSKNTAQGVTADYWRIDSIQWNKTTGQSTLRLCLYKDEATAKMDKSLPITAEVKNVKAEGRANCYAALKTSKLDKEGKELNPLAAAVDC